MKLLMLIIISCVFLMPHMEVLGMKIDVEKELLLTETSLQLDAGRKPKIETESFDTVLTNTMLLKLIYNNNIRQVERALESKDFDLDTKHALHLAARDDRIEILGALLESGRCDVLEKDDFGNTPLHVAARRKALSAMRLLLHHNADWFASNLKGRDVLYYILKPRKEFTRMAEQFGSIIEMIMILREFNKDFDWHMCIDRMVECDCLGYAAARKGMLLGGAYKGVLELVEYLLEQGMDSGVVDEQNNTLLHLAIEGGHRETAVYLMSHLKKEIAYELVEEANRRAEKLISSHATALKLRLSHEVELEAVRKLQSIIKDSRDNKSFFQLQQISPNASDGMSRQRDARKERVGSDGDSSPLNLSPETAAPVWNDQEQDLSPETRRTIDQLPSLHGSPRIRKNEKEIERQLAIMKALGIPAAATDLDSGIRMPKNTNTKKNPFLQELSDE